MNTGEHGKRDDCAKSMDGGTEQHYHYSDDVDIAALLRVIWRRKAWIAAATLLATMAAAGYALSAPQWYRAESVLMLRDSGAPGGLSAQLARLGGLASMAGITLGETSKQEPLGVLRSAGFSRRFVEQNRLESTLSEEMDRALLPGTKGARRSVQAIVDEFRKSILTVGEDKKTGLVTVVIEWKDPVVAATWANAISRQLNEEMRQRALDESMRNVEYLKAQLELTEIVSLQQAISRLIESEMQKLMLAQGTAEYSFRVIDEAQPPTRHSRPRRVALVIVTLLGALFVSTLAAVMFDPLRTLWQSVRVEDA